MPSYPVLKLRDIKSQNQDGQALVLVLGIMLTLTLFGLALVTISVNRVSATYQNQQFENAVAAANYGQAFALAVLNQEAKLPFICVSAGFCNNLLTVPGTSEKFELTLTPSNWQSICQNNLLANKNCTVTFNSTGYYQNAHATVSFTLSRAANEYLEYTYYTDYETADPADSAVYPNQYSWAVTHCQYHAYDYNPTTGGYGPDYSGGCALIEFGPSDVINGPLFTDDDPWICQATFMGQVYTGDPNPSDTPFWQNPGGCGSPNFNQGGFQEVGFLQPPPNTNAVGTAADVGGCIYYGPTFITLKPNDIVNVISPDTKYLVQNQFANAGGCGTPGNSSGGCLNTASGCTLNWAMTGCGLSTCFDGAVEIDNSPTNSTDPNYWPIVSGNSTAPTCSRGKVDGYYWHIDSEVTVPNSSPNGQNCLNGDLLIQGDPNSQTTAMVATNSNSNPSAQSVPGAFDLLASFAAQDNVIIVGNLVYNHGSSYNYLSNPYDALGLIAQNFIELNNPSTNSGVFMTQQTATQTENPVIDAALLAAAHSWTPINWNTTTSYEDGQGFLNITGSIIQKFRGIVGYIGYSGWNKNYVYDSNLLQNPPPWFPQPPWQILNYTAP